MREFKFERDELDLAVLEGKGKNRELKERTRFCSRTKSCNGTSF